MKSLQFFLLGLILIPVQLVLAQCPTPPATCDFTISGADAGTYTLNAGDTLCITSTGNFTGLVRFRGGVLHNCSAIPQTFAAAFQNVGSEFYNHGTWTNAGANYDQDIIVHNYGNITNSFAVTFNTDMILNNYGTVTNTSTVTISVNASINNYSSFTATGNITHTSTDYVSNYDGAVFSGNNITFSSPVYNSGSISAVSTLTNNAQFTNDGGCIASNAFTNNGQIIGLYCGTYTISGVSTNTGSILGEIALVDATQPTYPYVDSNTGFVESSVTGTSCGCTGTGAIPDPAYCPAASCDIAISAYDAGSYILNTGDTLCLQSGAYFHGTVEIRGGVLINCASDVQLIELNTPTGYPQGVIQNYGTMSLSFLTAIDNVDFHNNGSMFSSGNIIIAGDGILYNYGMAATGGHFTLQNNSIIHNYSSLTAASQIKEQDNSSFKNYSFGDAICVEFQGSSNWYNAGSITTTGLFQNALTATTATIEGGCIDAQGGFTNFGHINGIKCGTVSITGFSDNQGTLDGTFAVVDATAPVFPFVDSNTGTVGGSITGVSCGCPGVGPELCANAIDDDGDGLTDCDDPDCGVAITGEEMGKVASNVYSQVDFTSAVYNALDSTFASPTDVAIDPTTGKFFISDPSGNRILRYASEATFFTGGKAEGVLGQPDFLSTGWIFPPTASTLRNQGGIAIDENGNLFVADYYNRRVLRYDNVSSKPNGAAADGVLGQNDFTSADLNTTQDGMDYVADVVVHPNGSLIVSGKNNRRVLIFNNAASLGNGAPADVVLGKPDFTSNSPFTCTSSNIASAWYMELIGNSLYLSDLTCHRVMVWDDVFSKSNGAAADRVLGQSNFTASSILLDQKAIVQGTGFEKDDAGNLYIADSYHDRILFFEDANSLANGANAKSVYGQPDFVTTGPGTSATQFKDPRGMELIEYNGQSYLMVLDKQNYRALLFPQSVSTDELTVVSGTLHGSDPASTGSLTFSVVTQPVLGSVSIDNASTGAFTYTPTGACMLNMDSTLTFTYRITNGNSCFLETSISIFVTDVAPCPEICGNGIDDNGDGRIDEDLPAGVGDNLLLWLRADIGFGGGTWLDQSPNGNDANVFGDPTQIANSMNFNPGINFDGDDHVEVNLPELVFQSGNNHVVIFAVYKPSTAAFDIGMYGNQTATDVQNLYLQWNQVGKGNGSVVTTTPFGIKPHLITHIVDEEDNVGGGVNETELYHNGTLDLTYLFNETSSAAVDINFHIGKGGSHPTTSKYFLGDIHEIIIYFENDGNPSITDTERQKIESYLGTKYGISISHDYTDSQ